MVRSVAAVSSCGIPLLSALLRQIAAYASNSISALRMRHGAAGDCHKAALRAKELRTASAIVLRQYGHFLRECGWTRQAAAAYRKAHDFKPDLEEIVEYTRGTHLRLRQETGDTARYELSGIYLGTIGQCNASCAGCPTGKDITAHVPRIPMSMELFERVIREVSLEGYTIGTQVSFGLFGDALLDPFVVERARLLRRYLPDVYLCINTNAAAYNRKRHAALAEYCSVMTLHVESLNPDIYAALMSPLRLERVLPKMHQIMEDFLGRARVSIPVCRLNREEIPEIRDYFMPRGAVVVYGDPLISRCVDDVTVFNDMAVDPHKHWCCTKVLKDLVVDCDGEVLIFCNDFQRKEPVGNLATSSIRNVRDSGRRAGLMDLFEQEKTNCLETCPKCFVGEGETQESLLSR